MKASGETTRCVVVVNLLLLIMGLPTLVPSRTIASMVLVESSGVTSWASTTAAAWASSTRVAGSVAMKVAIRTISLMGRVTSYALTEEAMKENGVEGNGAVLEDRF